MGIKQFQKKLGNENEPRDRWLEKILEGLTEEGSVPSGGYFQVSVVGNTCDRFLYLHYRGLLKPEMFSARTLRIFDNGNVAQDRYEKYFKESDIYLDKEVVVTLDNPPLKGRADFIVSLNNTSEKYVVELKTINSNGFSRLNNKPKLDHEVQLQVYLNLLDIRRGGVIYENKDTQEVLVFSQYKDKEKWQKIVEKCNYIMNLKVIPDVRNVIHEKYCQCLNYIEDDFKGIL